MRNANESRVGVPPSARATIPKPERQIQRSVLPFIFALVARLEEIDWPKVIMLTFLVTQLDRSCLRELGNDCHEQRLSLD